MYLCVCACVCVCVRVCACIRNYVYQLYLVDHLTLTIVMEYFL